MIFWRLEHDRATVMVKVQPRSRRPGLYGVQETATGPRLKISVAEAAVDGKANRAACFALAKALDLPGGSVQLLSGATHREKTLVVSGDAASLRQKLDSL